MTAVAPFLLYLLPCCCCCSPSSFPASPRQPPPPMSALNPELPLLQTLVDGQALIGRLGVPSEAFDASAVDGNQVTVGQTPSTMDTQTGLLQHAVTRTRLVG